MVIEHILLSLFFFFIKILGRSAKPRAPARYEGESGAKIFLSGEARAAALSAKVTDGAARAVLGGAKVPSG